jgi:hypothetical protein
MGFCLKYQFVQHYAKKPSQNLNSRLEHFFTPYLGSSYLPTLLKILKTKKHFSLAIGKNPMIDLINRKVEPY